jgi:hypothetical protein
MKDHILKITLIILMVILSVCAWGQKPKVKVSFSVSNGTPLYFKYLSKMDSIETEGLKVLIDGLNRYIGFAEFTESTAGLTLNISLDSKFKDSDLRVREYFLLFQFVNEQNDTIPHDWKILDQNEYIILQNNRVKGFLEMLNLEWEDYLFVNYNNDLVNKLFGKIPLNIPDSSHSYIHDRGNDKILEFILPFNSQQLKIDKDDSEFKINITYLTNESTPTDMTADGAKISGVVDTITMGGVPAQLMGCIRLGSPVLTNITIPNFQSAAVFITQYRIRKIIQEDCVSLDCQPEME